ncbi:hypothetical protein MMC22_011204 [Lobaria immixta]|nr:hypothetical protein [Lobaria immixta]
MLLYAAVAGQLLSGLDPSISNGSVTPTLPDSSLPIAIIPGISDGLGNMAQPNIFSLDSNIAQEPSNGMNVEPATLNPDSQNNLEHSDSSCNPMSTATGRKVRRLPNCLPPGTSLPSPEPLRDETESLFEGTFDPGLPETEEMANDRLMKYDEQVMSQFDMDPKGPLLRTQKDAEKCCKKQDFFRTKPACCLGPPRERLSALLELDPTFSRDIRFAKPVFVVTS